MNPDQERDFIERQVDVNISRRHFMRWAGTAGLSGVAATALSGSILAACSSSGKKDKVNANAPKTADTAAGGFTSTGDTIKIGVIGVFSGVGAFIGRIVNNSLDAAKQQINSTGGVN